MDKERAEHVGNEIANRMAAHWGGQLIYFPIGTAIKLSARDLAIWNDFTGKNHSDLARKYGTLHQKALLVMILLLVVLPLISPSLNIVGWLIGPPVRWLTGNYLGLAGMLAGG